MSGDFPRTEEEIAADYTQRRAGLLKALTDGKRNLSLPVFVRDRNLPHKFQLFFCEDVDDLFAHCDPERENLCLYGTFL